MKWIFFLLAPWASNFKLCWDKILLCSETACSPRQPPFNLQDSDLTLMLILLPNCCSHHQLCQPSSPEIKAILEASFLSVTFLPTQQSKY